MTLPSHSRFYAWWYFAIALGFLLLAINKMMVGEKLWLIGIRLGISAGFAALGYLEFHATKRPR